MTKKLHDFGLEKIPDHIIIQNLQLQVGGLESYILELENKSKLDFQEEKKKIRQSVQSEEMYLQLKKDLSSCKKTNTSLRKEISELVSKL